MAACGWEVLGCENCSAYESLSPEIQAEAEAWAIDRLWKWTNQRFGPCEEQVRPCRGTDLVCGSCRGNCSCGSVYQVVLPGPIYDLLEVLIDGVAVDLSAFRVDNNTILVRQDGGYFPAYQDMQKVPTEENTWQISYLLGEEVPAGGSLVAGILACEYAKSLCGDSTCRLPRRVSSIQRQGVVIGILDNFTNLKDGFTGIAEIDDWIMSAVKPHRRSTITSPDYHPPRITTWSYVES